jgi:flagellar protein FliT
MMSMSDQIDLYEEICALSADMVNAARSNDWPRLVALERSVAALRDELVANSGPGPDTGTTAAENDHKRGLIQRILEDDAEIRRHTEPWMEHVRQFLGSQNRRKQVQQAYAATDSAPGGY